jgi:hypothetical protein
MENMLILIDVELMRCILVAVKSEFAFTGDGRHQTLHIANSASSPQQSHWSDGCCCIIQANHMFWQSFTTITPTTNIRWARVRTPASANYFRQSIQLRPISFSDGLSIDAPLWKGGLVTIGGWRRRWREREQEN